MPHVVSGYALIAENGVVQYCMHHAASSAILATGFSANQHCGYLADIPFGILLFHMFGPTMV